MSSYLSQPYEMQAPQESVNVQLVGTVLNTLQGKYDANKAKIEQMQAAYGNMLKGLRDTDNEYIAARLEEANSIMNAYRQKNGNLAYSSVTDTITSALKSVAEDPIIQAAVVNKAKYDRYNTEVAEIKKKGDGKYSDINYQYGLYKGGMTDYMSGKTKDLGSLSYTPYTDYSKEFKEISENLDKYANVTKVKRPDGNGYLIMKEGKYLNESEVRNIAESLLSDGAKQQLGITGWGAYGQDTVENVSKAYKEYSDTKLKSIDDKIAQQKLLYKNDKTNDKYANNIKSLEAEKESLISQTNDALSSGNKDAMAGYMYKDMTLNKFSNVFSFNNVSEEWDNDVAWHNKREMEYKAYKDSRDWEYKDIEVAQKNAELMLKGVKIGADGKPVLNADGTPQIITKIDDTAGDYKQDVEKVVDKQEELIAGYDTSAKSLANEIYSTLDEDDKKAVNDIIKQNGISKENAIYNLFKKGDSVNKADIKSLGQLLRDRDTETNRLVEAERQVEKESEKAINDNPALIERLYKNPDIKIMWYDKNGKERLYSASEVLTTNGFVDSNGKARKTLSQSPGLAQAIKKSMLADKIITRTNENPRVTNFTALKNLASLFGENFEEVTSGGTRWGDNVSFNPNTKTGKFILNQKSQGGYNRAGIFSADDSFDDINEGNEYFKAIDPTEKKAKVAKILFDDGNTKFTKKALFPKEDIHFKDLNTLTEGKIEDNDKPFQVTIDTTDPAYVYINKATEVKREKAASVYEVLPETAVRVRKQDVPQQLLNRLDLDLNKSKMSYKAFPVKDYSVWFEDSSNKSRVEDIGENYFNGDIQKAYAVTKQGLKSILYSQYPEQIGDYKAPNNDGLLINSIIESPNRIVVKPLISKNGTKTTVRPEIYYKNTNGDDVLLHQGDKVDERLLDNFADELEFTPQIIIAKYLNEVLKDNTGEKLEKLKKVYGK